MVLSSILRRKSTSNACSNNSSDTLLQLSNFLNDLRDERLSRSAEETRKKLLEQLSNKKKLKITVKRLSLQSAMLGSSASSITSNSPHSPEVISSPETLPELSTSPPSFSAYDSPHSLSPSSPILSPLLSPIMSPSLNRVSFVGSSSDGYEIDVDLMLDSVEELTQETYIRPPIPKRFRKKTKKVMTEINERDQLMVSSTTGLQHTPRPNRRRRRETSEETPVCWAATHCVACPARRVRPRLGYIVVEATSSTDADENSNIDRPLLATTIASPDENRVLRGWNAIFAPDDGDQEDDSDGIDVLSEDG